MKKIEHNYNTFPIFTNDLEEEIGIDKLKDLTFEELKEMTLKKNTIEMYIQEANEVSRLIIYCYLDDLSTVYFRDLYVQRNHRNKGYATDIINFACQISEAKNIILKAEKTSFMFDWYIRLGFKLYETSTDETDDNYVWMKKKLKKIK